MPGLSPAPEGQWSKALGSGIRGARGVPAGAAGYQRPLVFMPPWQRGLNRSAHAGLAPMAAGPPAQMAHPKGLMKPVIRPIRANRTPFVWTDVFPAGQLVDSHRFGA